MTQLPKRVLDSLPRLRSKSSPDRGTSVMSVRPLKVEVRLPEELRAVSSDDLHGSLRVQMSALLDELGLDRELVITGQKAVPGISAITVAIDGHPVAYFRGDHLVAKRNVEALLEGVMSRTLRRLPLLAGSSVGERSILTYLTALGCRVPLGAVIDTADIDAAEQLIDARTGEEILLEVAAPTMRRLEADGVRDMIEFREAEFRKRGVVFPNVRVILIDGSPGFVRLRLNDVTLPKRWLGEEAGWNDVLKYVGKELAARRHWFVRMRDVSRLLDEDLVFFFPDLVAVSEANYSRAQVTACLRELVLSGWRMRNFPRILWLLLEQGGSAAGSDVLRLSESPLLPKARHRPPAERDPMVMAVRVRKLAAEESWRLGNYRASKHTVRLSPDIEDQLATPGSMDLRARAEWAAVRAFAATPEADCVVARTVGAIGPVRDALQAVEKVPRVVSSHELPPDADMNAFPVLTDQGEEV